MKTKISLITDTASTLSLAQAKKLGIELIPLGVYDAEGNSLSEVSDLKVISQKLGQGEQIKTSSTPLGIMIEKFIELLKNYDQVIYLTVSSKLSGQYNQACLAASEVDSEKIHVIDSQTAAYGLEQMTINVKKMITNENVKIDQVKNFVNEFSQKTFSCFFCDNVKYIANSGRVDSKLRYLSKIIRPIIFFDSKPQFIAVATTAKAAINRLIKIFIKHVNEFSSIDQIDRLVIYHCDCSALKIDELMAIVQRKIGVDPKKIVTRSCTTVLLSHIGPGSMGLGV